jgi:hypothetical protein
MKLAHLQSGTAQTSVEQKPAETPGSTTSQEPVSTAKENLSPTNTPSEFTVATLVARRQITSLEPVYNITVADKHEYFANGILNSNCDAVLYAWRESYSFTSKIPVKKPAFRSPEWMEAEVRRMEEEAEEYFKKLAEDERING